MIPGQTRRATRLCVGAAAVSMAAAALSAPVASAAPDCSPAGIDGAVASAMQQARAYLNTHQDANRMLLTAAMQSQPEAAQTIGAYANSNPQEYADFKAILTPLSSLQAQCGVQVVPPEYQWAFDQFIS